MSVDNQDVFTAWELVVHRSRIGSEYNGNCTVFVARRVAIDGDGVLEPNPIVLGVGRHTQVITHSIVLRFVRALAEERYLPECHIHGSYWDSREANHTRYRAAGLWLIQDREIIITGEVLRRRNIAIGIIVQHSPAYSARVEKWSERCLGLVSAEPSLRPSGHGFALRAFNSIR